MKPLGIALLALTALSCGPPAGVTVLNPRSPEPPLDVMAVYFTVENPTDHADTLIAGRIEGFAPLEIHETTMVDGAMVMRPINPVVIPPGESLVLEPGGVHGMISGFTTKPTAGDELTITLTFALTGDVEFALPIVTYADLES